MCALQAEPLLGWDTLHGLQMYLCDARHDETAGPAREADLQGEGLVSKWRQKERLKTTAVALVVCLNIGVDPPDVIKISPCARLECWVDPLSMQAPKALDTIGAPPPARLPSRMQPYQLPLFPVW
jgi:regulator-associated protein of mTOR